ncbi:MAG: hypothetical protein IH819_00100 [Bacteroidetes bacterium]|nr:hypothetical protein [Bacteroidota bacterium]MCH9028029.1 hypothetical protein [Bacteroidota bacterium]
MGEEKFIMNNSIKKLNHFIFPFKNFSLEVLDPNFKFVLDESENIYLKTFDYRRDIEKIDSDQFSVSDRIALTMEYRWGLRFKCFENEKNKYLEKCNLLLLTFRIFNRSDCSGIYLLNVTNPHLSVKEDNIWKWAIANKHNKTDLKVDELRKIKIAYDQLNSFYITSPRTKHSIQFLYLGYISNYWMQAFILYMTALETLVSPDIKSDRITSIIVNRIMRLITNDSICSKNQLNKIY